MKNYKILTLLLFISPFIWGQSLTQNVRGTLVDADTKMPIIGARIILMDTDPLVGTKSDFNGDFLIESIPVGRVHIKITSIGYRELDLANLLIESGKEKMLNMEMVPDVELLKGVEVSATRDKSESINKMATVSAKTFTVEETNRYAGTFNDPARMASSFAGVVGNAEGDNDIVVRGNSPRGILWRLEGIDIPNPNHFAGEGTTGGPISALNGAMLANSDFFSAAFPADYGNALSGVFDVNYRQGNANKREYSFSLGALGIDGTLEGPFKKGYRGSYLINYRYSTIALIDKLEFVDFGGIPIYQDASFKFYLPTEKFGTFSLIGLLGKSNILQKDIDEVTEKVYGEYDFRASIGVVGLKNTYIINPKLYVKSYVAATSSYSGVEVYELNKDSALYHIASDGFRNNTLKGQTVLNYKANQKNLFQLGGTYTFLDYDFAFDLDEEDTGVLENLLKANGNSGMYQAFANWKYRISNDFTLVSGVHYTQLALNNNFTVEPRVGLNWKFRPRHDLSAGFGLHSRLESLSTYMYNELQEDGSYYTPNKNLDFSKSSHFVVGYGFQLTEHLRMKVEGYYQYLYNIPVVNDSSSQLSLINSNGGIPSIALVNEGKGRNYGFELTLERYFNNNFYYLVTGSIYKAEYAALDGVYHGSRYDANFAGNLVVGKEFIIGDKKNQTIGLNTKVSLLGGNRYIPIDLAASIDAGYEIEQENQRYSAKGENVFIMNLGLTYRIDKKRASHSFKIDIQNVTNHQAVTSQFYNERTQKLDNYYQLSLLPNVIYTIKF